MPKKSVQADINIVDYGARGEGIGEYFRADGKKFPIAVSGTMPGDCVSVQVLSKRRGIYRSLLKTIKTPAPEREQPQCLHFERCGGCQWQHIPYSQQLSLKEGAIHNTFAEFVTPQLQRLPIIACAPPWRYRNKMEFSFSTNAAGDNFLGLVMQGSRRCVLNVEQCHLCAPWMSQLLEPIRQWWKESALDAYHMRADTGSLRTLILRQGVNSGDRLVMLTVSGNPDYALKRHQLDRFVEVVRNAIEAEEQGNVSIFLRIQQVSKGMATHFYEMPLYGPDYITETMHISDGEGATQVLSFHVSPSAFFQPNTRQAEKLYSAAIKAAGLTGDTVVYDLFCGTGTLGICASLVAKEVTGIELSPESALDARTNARINGRENVTICTGDVARELNRLQEEGGSNSPDVVIVDPPRAGLEPTALKLLIQLNPQRIVYVSCNPTTQARDCHILQEGGYRLLSIQPVDQFPHTVHVENIVVLEYQGAQ